MTTDQDKNGLQPIGAQVYAMPSRRSMPLPTQPSAERVDYARRITKRLLATFPDYGKATAEYVIAIADAISWMTDAEIETLMDPRDGYVANADGFLPSVGKLHEFLRNKQAKAEQFKSHPTSGYKRLTEARGPWDEETDYERKKRLVKEVLGYDPNDPVARRDPPAFKTKKIEEFKSSADCARQDEGPSKELLELIERQDSDPVRWS